MAVTRKTTKAASEVKEETKKPGRKSSAETKEPAKKTTAKKETAKTASAKKTEEVKTEEVKEAVKKEEVKETVTFQFGGKSYTPDDLLKSCKDVWKYDLNGKEEDIKTIELYVKPEENVTYYVINGDVNGNFPI